MTEQRIREIYKEVVELYNRFKQINQELEKDNLKISDEIINGLSKDVHNCTHLVKRVSGYLKFYNNGAVSLESIKKMIDDAIYNMSTIIAFFKEDLDEYPPELKSK